MASKEYQIAVKLLGEKVTITKVLHRRFKGSVVTWESTEVWPTEGWVTGIRFKQNGVYVPYAYTECGDSPPYLKQTSTVPCLLIVTNALRNPLPVPFDEFIASLTWYNRYPNLSNLAQTMDEY
jgi:hypothetical protein